MAGTKFLPNVEVSHARNHDVRATLAHAEENYDATETRRLAAVDSRPGRMVHRYRANRSPSQRARTIARLVRQRDIRTGRAVQLAHPSSRPNADRHRRLRLDAMRGRTDRRDPRRRRYLVPTRPQALARCNADHVDDAYRNAGGTER